MSDSASQTVAEYQVLVQRYEQLDAVIRDLLTDHDLTRAAQLPRYRQLARERDDLFSEMRALEQQLRLDDE